MTYENPWIYNGKIFDTKDIDDNAGFVYRITNTTNGHDYIGRKFFTKKLKRPPLKARKTKESAQWKQTGRPTGDPVIDYMLIYSN